MTQCQHCGKPLPKRVGKGQNYFCSPECKRKSDRQKRKERREYLLAHGLCTSCGSEDALPGLTLCQKCRDTKSGYNQKYRQQRIEAGKCPRCGNDTDMGQGNICSVCAAKSSKHFKLVHQKRIDAGMCPSCGKRPAFGGRQECAQCADKRNRNYWRKKSAA